ncbi:MAG TPA: LamG domain-containing protein [Thermoanaerobaculaceae bacterium]|nr:LamG domain-containing protein [Thermoanaerobaculaceae bacterium]HRS16844.1 LamG domain-containing protein [Thermoanaerobaculaceae bacterium]
MRAKVTLSAIRRLAAGVLLLALGATANAQVGTSFLVFPETGDGYVEIPHSPALNPTTAITVEAWLYLADGRNCVSHVGKSYTEAYWLGICDQRLRFYARGSGSSRDSTGVVPLLRWTHIAVTHDGTVQRFYIDGEPAGEFNMGAGPLTESSVPLNIGSDPSYRITPKGAVQEVRLWSIARTQAAIAGDRLMRISTSRPGLVAVWPLDTDARDALGVHNGTLKGGAAFGSMLPQYCSYSYWVATAAHLTGAGGSQWATDLVAFNRDTAAASIRMYMLPRDGDNGEVEPVTRSVPAGQSLTLPDVVLGTFGQSSLAGAIHICADRELAVTARTYTREGSKTYGFGSQATRRESAIGSGSTRRITDIRENAAFRTNLGLTNVSRSTVTVKVTLTLADGTAAGEQTYTLKPWSHIQRNRVVRDFTATNVAGATLAIEPSGGAVVAYAAIVDNSTNDSTYVEALY